MDDLTRADKPYAGGADATPVRGGGSGADAPERRQLRRRMLAGGALLLLVLIGTAVAMRRHKGAPQADPAAPLVTVFVPRQSEVTGTASFTGTISARYDQPIGVEGDGELALLSEVSLVHVTHFFPFQARGNSLPSCNS